MSNNTFYFSHDYNARSDAKIKHLIRKEGYAGYGIFWAIVEDLYYNENAMQLDADSIAYDLRTDVDIVHRIINDYQLFIIDNGIISSESIQKRLDKRNEKSVKAKKSAEKRWSNTNDMPTHTEGNAIKERKGKEIKVKDIIELPFNTIEFSNKWNEWKDYKKSQHKFVFKTGATEKTSLNQLVTLSGNDSQIAVKIIDQSIASGWKGFFELKNLTNGNNKKSTDSDSRFNARIEYANRYSQESDTK